MTGVVQLRFLRNLKKHQISSTVLHCWLVVILGCYNTSRGYLMSPERDANWVLSVCIMLCICTNGRRVQMRVRDV